MMKKNKKLDVYQLQHIKDIIEIEQRDRVTMSLSDRIASWITAFSGSMLYVVIHVIWFGLWILLNTGAFGMKAFDPFPYSLLTMSVSLEAIFLASFVLISQNKQAIQADKRAKVDLQVNMIAERENTKLIEMIAEIQHHLKIHPKEDAEVRALKKPTDITKLADAIDKAEDKLEKGKQKKPQSAADTSK